MSQATREAFWQQVESLFSGLLFSTAHSSLNTTTVGKLVATQQRAVMYVSPGNFSGGSVYSLDGCTIDNELPDGVSRATEMIPEITAMFANATNQRAADKAANSLYLLSMSNGWSSDILLVDALLEYFGWLDGANLTAQCLAIANIPNMTRCPLHLMDAGLLGNYYNQAVFDIGVTGTYDLPGVIYIDSVDVNGTIRTGPKLFGPFYGGLNEEGEDPHDTAKYAYVDTMLLATVRRLCGLTGAAYPPLDPTLCSAYVGLLQKQRALYPTQKWEDQTTGRYINWP